MEYYRAVYRALRPGGVFLANIGDAQSLARTRAELAGLTHLFAHTHVAASAPVLAGGAYGNVVVAASDQPLSFDGEVPSKPGQLLIDDSPARHD